MCGLVGVISSNSFDKQDWLTQACKTMAHRGPDHQGEWWSDDKRVGLGHQRLSIIDLSSSGNQPMHLANKGLSIIFNGEIYNHHELRDQLKILGCKFYSQSDTEVLLVSYEKWGTNCLNYINGMFAFALYDSKKKQLFMARDRAGEKPLFYYLDNQSLYFASELKALLCNQSLPRKIDPISLDCYLSFGFIPGERCIFSNYNKLKPAHALTFDLKSKKLNIWKYWQPYNLNYERYNFDENLLLNELESILEDSVQKQLLADVPVGILLSGGLDSSLITAMASRHSNTIQTYSVTFPGYGNFDESFHSKMVASHFKTEHKEIKINTNLNTVDLLPKLIHHFDEPVIDSSMFPTYLLSQEVRKYHKVVLGGDGGDELFGGYHHYQRLLRMRKYLKYLPQLLTNSVSYFAKQFLPTGFKGKNYLENSNINFNNDIPLIANYFTKKEREKLINQNIYLSDSAENIRSASIPKINNFTNKVTLMDFENYLAEDILVKVDRSSMAHSLEVRAPFLDYRIIEFAFRKVPPHLKVNTKDKKILLKKLALKVLPDQFDLKRKQGFSIPLNQWLKKGPIRDHFWETLISKDCLFDKKIVLDLFGGLDKGRNNSERIFALVQFELWRKNFKAYL